MTVCICTEVITDLTDTGLFLVFLLIYIAITVKVSLYHTHKRAFQILKKKMLRP